MSENKVGDFASVKEAHGKFLRLGFDEKTQKANIVHLVAYAPDPDDAEATLLVAESGYLVFQEIKARVPFADFDACVQAGAHISMLGIGMESVRIDRKSPLGRAVVDYKANIAEMLHPPAPGIFH